MRRLSKFKKYPENLLICHLSLSTSLLQTALHISSERGHVENIRGLLSAGADLSILTASGDTALALAERGRHRHAALALREAKGRCRF